MPWPFRRKRTNPMDVDHLLAEARAAASAEADAAPAVSTGPFQFEVEDVFVITGRGTVTTGRIGSGQISVGNRVTIERAGAVIAEAEIHGIEKFRATTQSAVAGENVGLLFRDLGKDELQRGDIIR